MPMQKLLVVPAEGNWVVRAGGAVIGESARALELVEGDGTGVVYFPPEDLGMAFLEDSPTVASSSTLGEARFYTIVTGSGPIRDAAWSYQVPLPGAERIAGHIAFDPARVTIEEV